MSPTSGGAVKVQRAEVDPEFERQLVWALEAANLPTILAVLVHLTGNREYLEGEFQLGPMRGSGDHDDGGLPEATQEKLRRAASEVILGHLGGTLPAVADPSPEDVVQILSMVLGDKVPVDAAGLLAEELGTLSRAPTPLPKDHRDEAPHTLIVGTGFSGLAAAIRLGEAGLPFTIIDKNDGIGGTWHENVYPGCGVDTPVHLYSFAFAQRSDWPKYFAGRTEVRDYLVGIADRYEVNKRVRYGIELTSAAWDESTQKWNVTLTRSGGTTEQGAYDVIVSAVGQFNRPKTPSIPGLDTFPGPVLHTGAWDDSVDLADKRVAVIGTGASAMQLVPAVRSIAKEITVYQRSPQWILPNPNTNKDVSPQKQFLMEHVPWYLGWYRLRLAWNFGDRMHPMLRIDPEWKHMDRSVNAINERHRVFLTNYIQSQLADRPDLVDRCIPAYPPYGKRPLLDHGWFDAIKSDNIHLVTEGVVSVDGSTVVSASGQEQEVDLIVLATGFDAINMLGPMEVTGRSGASLRDIWGADDARAYLGMTVPDFPNFFMLFGPNTNAGHGGSLVMTVEMQVRYLIEILTRMAQNGVTGVEVRPESFEQFNEDLDNALAGSVWSHPGMTTYYRNSKGRIVTNLPWTNTDYWHRTRHVNADDFFEVSAATDTRSGAPRRGGRREPAVMSENVATLSTFLGRLAKRETMRQALELVDDDFVAQEPASLPYGGTYRGPAGLLDMLRAVNAVVRLDVKDVRLNEVGEFVMARVEVDIVARESGEAFPTRVVELYTVANGLIKKLDIFYHDTAAIHQLIGAGSSGGQLL
ncbi:FAD-dependent oxidoreductase [Streptomyces sp. NBC_01320]|uniref:FAD-dependent oxidoreductase n=1 Tax=Streptomyces sp. NBC_01320 TaxID=2903824 RepID=UPI002E13FDF2|nr:FAD-dependent oxidoreductase [Streptomyces sp. NBC_01320]